MDTFAKIAAVKKMASAAAGILVFVLAGLAEAPGCLFTVQAAPKTAAGTAKASAASGEKAAPVDVNSAGLEALIDLPGIGRSTAQRIIDYRKEHGPFKTVDELLNVRGIGEKSLARFRDRVTIGSGGSKN